MVKVGIIGSTGYAGQEIVRLLLGHKEAEIVWYGSRSYIDKKYYEVFGNMFQIVENTCLDDNMEELANQVDVIFTATPQGLCASLVNEDILKKVKIVDLSADFRIQLPVQHLPPFQNLFLSVRLFRQRLPLIQSYSLKSLLKLLKIISFHIASNLLRTYYHIFSRNESPQCRKL